jgi:hypothetical protein
VLVDAGADKEAKANVSQRRGKMLGGRTIFIFSGVCIETAAFQCADEGSVDRPVS